MQRYKMRIVKRFKCECGYLSPAGYKVNECDCLWCKIPMTRGLYRQYKNHCKEMSVDERLGYAIYGK